VAGAVGFAKVVADSVTKAADMEQSVADIGAVMNTTSDVTQKLHDHILDLGLDPKLKVSATEAAAAVEQLGTAGLTADQIMNGASRATILLANATGLSGNEGLSKAASIATDIMQQFNITTGQMNDAVSAVAGVTIASKFTVDDYRLAIAQAGGVAGALGVSFDDFNAAIAATSSSFASGSDSGTSFKVFLQRLMPVSDKAAEYMNKIGLSTAGVGSAFFDSSGKMKSMSEIAGLLQTAFGGLSDAEKDEAASHIFGTDAMRSALALAKGGPEIIDRFKASVGNVNAEDLAAKRMDTFRGSIEIAQGVIETISIGIGEQFLPVLRPLIDRFTELATTYGPQVIAFFKQTADAVASMISPFLDLSTSSGGIWEAFQGMVPLLGTIIDDIKLAFGPVTSLISKFVSWKDVLAALAITLGSFILPILGSVLVAIVGFLAPIVAVAAEIAALRWAWENDFGHIRTTTLDTLSKISDWFYRESGIWKGTWEETWAYIADRVRYFFQYQIYNFIVGNWANIREKWRFYTTIIHDETISWIGVISNRIEGFVGDLGQQFNIWRDKALSTWDEWTGPTLHALGVWASDIKGKFENAVGWITGDFGVLTKMKKDALAIFDAIVQWWDDNIQPWTTAGSDAIQGLWDGISAKWDDLSSWFEGVWRDLTNKFKHFFGIASPSKVFAGYGENMMKGLAQGLGAGQDAVYGALDGLNGGITTSATATYNYAPSSSAGNSNARVEQLLETLIAELRAKNMSVTVAGGGGGMGLGALVGLTSGLPR
jgi:TP901 family phage tail tape measure protein